MQKITPTSDESEAPLYDGEDHTDPDSFLGDPPNTDPLSLKSRLLTEVKQTEVGYFDIDELIKFIEAEVEKGKSETLNDVSTEISAMLYKIEHRDA